MIRIGLSKNQRLKLIKEYLLEHSEINYVLVLNTKQHGSEYKLDIKTEHVIYDDWDKYRVFYPLLEKIDEKTLIVFDEPYRTKNFGDLKYNCGVVYANQTPHRIIFSTFPIINEKEDFNILLKFERAQKSFLEKFEYIDLQKEDIKIKPVRIKMNLIEAKIDEKQKQDYEKKKESLFDKLGSKDPNTIPRELQIYAGNMKKGILEEDKFYLARNSRFKMDNVHTYKNFNSENSYTILDYHYNPLVMMDYFIKSKPKSFDYITTGLSIDSHIINEFSKWKARCDSFYAQANLY